MSTQTKMELLCGKIHEYSENPKIQTLFKSRFAQMDEKAASDDTVERLVGIANRLATIGNMQLCFAVSQLANAALNNAVVQLSQGICNIHTMESVLRTFRQHKKFDGELENTTEVLLPTLGFAIILGARKQARWLAETVVTSYQANDDWVDDDEYLVSMLYTLALNYTQSNITGDDEADYHPLVKSLLEADGDEAIKTALESCCEHRFKAACQAQIQIKDNEYINCALAGIPVEILAFKAMYNLFSSSAVVVEHEGILSHFRDIDGRFCECSDKYIECIKMDVARLK